MVTWPPGWALPPLLFLLLLGSALVDAQNGYNFIDNSPVLMQDRVRGEPSYFVLASRTVRPGQVYSVIATVYRSSHPITVRASIQRNGVELCSASHKTTPKIPETLLLKVPPTSVPGSYKLRVEGNVNSILGGTAFINETSLEFSQRSMTIFIQTDRPLYHQGQLVRFRALPITMDLKAFPDAIDVYMLDPERNIMRRWLSRQSNLGAVSLEYDLSLQPKYGNWTIQVIAQGQIEEKSFVVEEYYQTLFEVNVTLPEFLMESDSTIDGSIMANYTSGAPVTGNLTLKLYVEPYRVFQQDPIGAPVLDQYFRIFEGFLNFHFPMKELRHRFPSLDRARVTVHATVGERFLNKLETGFARALIFGSQVQIRFLGSSPQVFKPTMPFKCYVVASYMDGSSVSHFSNTEQQLEVRAMLNKMDNSVERLDIHREVMARPGVWEVKLDLAHLIRRKEDLQNIKSMALEAHYRDANGHLSKADLLVYAYYAPEKHYLHIYTSTKTPKVGEFIIFHVQSNYYVEQLYYVLLSKGIILTSGHIEMTSTLKTFDVPLSAEMAPSATILIYDLARNGEVVTDSLTFPVNGISRNNFTVSLNPRKDKTGNTVEVVVRGVPGSYVGLSALDRTLFFMQADAHLTQPEVLRKMNSFDQDYRGTLSHTWQPRKDRPEQTIHFPSSSYGLDANHTFEFAGLVAFTDANITSLPNVCNSSLGLLSCMDGSCYPASKKCDTYMDCPDGSDESACPPRDELHLKDFRLSRVNRYQRLYDNSWLWHDINIGPLGHHIFSIPVPDIPTDWIINAFSMNHVHGFGVHFKTLEFSSTRPFYMNVEMPTRCLQGEQIGIRITLFNYMHFEIEVLVILADSPDYRFIHVEPFGEVSSYSPRTSGGEHHHLVFIKPGKTMVVYMPIVPTRLGDINITLIARTQVAKDVVTKTIHVDSDGIPQYRHTSLLLDLTQGAYLIKYLDTNITDTPEVPYRQDRLYVYGSNRATFSIVGEVIGPAFPTMPMNATSLLRKPFWCGEQNMFNFGVNMYMLRYMKLTGLRQPAAEKLAFKYLNIGYQRQLSYRLPDGSFTPFRWHRQPSVWLTALCARVFHAATFPEWENFLFIDPRVISDAVDWLLGHQTSYGAFVEISLHPLDRKMDLASKLENDNVKLRNISLTAHVLITLAEIKDLPGDIGAKARTAAQTAQAYLEKMLHVVKNFEDPYELAIVAYALTRVNSVDGEEAFNLLGRHMREISGMKYWGRIPVPPPKVQVESNRPHLLGRLPNPYDASNVETTAYALLVNVHRQGLDQRGIVEWLNSQRLTDGGWASTQDTLVALNALMEYSIRVRQRDVTDVTVTVEAPSTPGFTRQLHIGMDNLLERQALEIPNAWGVVVVKAQGAGMAIVQLDVQYNVDWPHLMTPPPVQAFSLEVRHFFHGRNSSHLTFFLCQSWTLLEESATSGMAVLQVAVPTGYYVQQQELDSYVRSQRVPRLQEARFQDSAITFYFDYLEQYPTCVQFTAQRWYPVANMTRYLPIRVYDFYAPERYNETMFDAFNLFVLNICQVCGSYQCPYCPVFSSAPSLAGGALFLLAVVMACLLSQLQ